MVARGLIYVGRNSNKFTQPFETMATDAAFAAAEPAAAEAPLLLAQPFPVTILQISQHLRLEKFTNEKTYLRKADGTSQEISSEVYETMVGQHTSKRQPPLQDVQD